MDELERRVDPDELAKAIQGLQALEKEREDIVLGFIKEKEITEKIHNEELEELRKQHDEEMAALRQDFMNDKKELLRDTQTQQVEYNARESEKAKENEKTIINKSAQELKESEDSFKIEKRKLRDEYESVIAQKTSEIEELYRENCILRSKSEPESFENENKHAEVLVNKLTGEITSLKEYHNDEIQKLKTDFDFERSEIERNSVREKAEFMKNMNIKFDQHQENNELEKMKSYIKFQNEMKEKITIVDELWDDRCTEERNKMSMRFDNALAQLKSNHAQELEEKLAERNRTIEELEQEKDQLLHAIHVERFELAKFYNRELSILNRLDTSREDIEVALIDEVAKLRDEQQKVIRNMEKRHKRKMNDLKEKQKPVEEIEEQHKNDMDDLKRFYEKDKEQLEAQLRNEQLALLKSFEFEKSDIERYYQQAIEDRENEHKQEIEQLQQEHNQEIKRMGSLEKENIELKEKFSELNDKNNELTDKLQEFESQNARLKEELEKENRGKREQLKEMKGLESSSDIQRTMEELSKSNIQLANQLANEQQKCEELLKRSQELEKLYEEAQGSGDENAEPSSSTADNTKAHDARNTSETEITVTTADDVESGPPLADTRQRLSATPRDELARSSSRSTPVDKEKELQDSLQQYLLELKSIQESLDTKETEMRQVKQDYEQENNRLKQSMQDLKDSINDVFDDNDEQDDDLETMKARHKQIKDIINKDQSDDKTEKRDVPTEDRNIMNDDNKSPSDFRAEVDALDKIIDEDFDEAKDGKQLKENLNNKLKAIKANILRMHDLELLECQQRYEKEQNNYLKELTNEKDTELDISNKVWEAVCEKLGIEGEKSKEKLQELLQKDDPIQEESNEEESEKNNGENSGKTINTDEVEQLKREKEDLERSIGEIEKHFKKEKKKLIKKLETQHREFVLSSEAEVIDALTKEKKLLEEAFNTERFNLGRLYYMEMLDELEDLMSERKDDLEKEKSEIIFKFNEDIADLLKALADKDKNEVELLKDKNAMVRKIISMQRRTNEDDKKLDDNELDDIKAEAEKLDAIIPLKKELAELQRKRQEEHERNAENLGKAVDVIKDLLADKAKEQEGKERRFSFQTLGSDYGSILGAEHEPTGRSSQLLAVGSNTPSETSRASSRSGKSKKSREPTPTLSPSRSNSRSAENAQSSPKPHSRKGTPTSSRGQGSSALSTSRSPIRGRSPGIQQEDIIEEENISNLNTEPEQQSPSPRSNILNEINSKEDLLKALESLIDDAFAEDKNYESDTSSGAISDFESQPATPKSEKEEGGSDSGAESVDSELLSIKKSELDLALNLERFGLGRVYYNEYKDSLQDAFRKLAKAKGKSETLENKLMDDVKDLVDRTNFAKASAPSTEAETQTNADEVVDNPSPKFEKYTASGVAEQKQDDKEDIKDEPKSEEAEQESVKDPVKEKTAQEDKKMDETTDKELEQEDIPSNDTAKTQEQKIEEQPSKPNEKTKDQVEALATDEDTSSQAGVNRKTETKNAETQTDDQFIENKKTDKDDSPTDKTEDKQDLMEKLHDSEPQRKDPVDEIITEPLVRAAERIPWLGSGVPEGDFFQEKDGVQQPERKDDAKDDLSSEQNAESTATEKIPDASTEPEINSTDDVTIQQAEELQSDGSQPDDVLEEKDFEGDKPNKEEQITKEEIEEKTAKGDEKKETAVDSIKDILDDETKDLAKEYKKLKDNYNILKALVGKSFVDKIPELNDNKGNEQEDDSSIDEGALKNLIEEEKCIAEDLKSIEKQLDALRNMSNSNVREEEKKLNDKELEALKELENINDQLKKEEDKDLIEHLQNEKVEVEKKLKEIERDLEEKRAHIDDKEQNVFDLLKKKLDLEGDIAKKAQKLDKHHKKLADMKQDDEAENFDREIENLKQQEKALQDLIDSHFPHLSSTSKENAEVTDPSSDQETKAQSDIGTKQGSPTNNEKQRVGKDSDGITTMQLDRPNVDDIVKQVKEQGRGACKAAKKLQQAQRDKDRYNRMTEDQAQRLKPFLQKRQRLEDALGISDEQEDATLMNKPNGALSLQDNKTPRDTQQKQQDQVKPSALVDEDRRDDIKHQREKVDSKTSFSDPDTSKNRKRPSKENLIGKDDEEEPSVSKDNAREDKADKRGQQYSNKTSIFDPEALQKERAAIKDALKQVEDQLEYLTDKAKQSSYKPGVGPIVDHIQALEVEIESANENIGPIIENVKPGNNEDDIIKLIEAKSEQESQISDILSNLPDAFDSLPEDIQNAFELACLKNDLDGDIADLKSNIDKEESCFLEAVKYQREGMLDDIDSPLGEVVKSQQKLRGELSDLAMQIADARDKDEMPENLQQMMQTKNEIEQQIDKLQDQIEQEPARAAEHLSELIKTKHEKEDDVMNTAHQLKEAAKEFDLHDIPEQIADVISSQNDLEDKRAISSKTKDLETEIQETAAEVSSLYQHQKNPEGKEDKLVQLINEHKSIVQQPKLNDESQLNQQPTIPPAVFATQLRKLKDDLHETESKIKAVKDKCNDDEIDHMNKLEDLITEKHEQEKEKELFENLLDCLYKKDQLEKELKENKAKEELFEVNEVIEKKEGEIKRLKDNVEELDALLENLMNEMNNNVSGETEIENTVKDTLSDIRQQLEHVEKEKEKRVNIQQNAEEHLTEAVSTLEDELEESREELDFIENELEHSQDDPDNGGTLSKDLLDMTALLNTKKSLEDYLLEIDTKLDNSNDSEREPLSPDEINVLRAKKRDAENKLDEIQTEKSKFEIELQDDEIQETVDALTEEKKQLEMQKNALMGKIHGGNIFSRLADEMEEERPSDEDQQYYTHALNEMIAGPKTLIQLAEENEKLKDIASNQRKLLEDMNKRFRDSLGDNLANAIAPQSTIEGDNLATAITPHSIDEGDNLATALTPQSNAQGDNLATALTPQSADEGDNLATALTPQSTDEGDNLATAIAPQSTDEEKQSSDIPSPIIDRLANQETIQSIVSDLSNENNKLRDMNDELLNDLESLKDKVGEKLAKYLLDPNEDEDKAALGTICNLIDKDTTIQEVLERQDNDAERIKERLGKDLANALRTPTDDSISGDILMEVPRAAIIMKDTDEDLESVLAAYEDKLELLDRENNALKSMLGNDLVHALLELDQSKHHDGQPSPSMPDKKAPDNLSKTTQEDTKGLDDRSPLHHRKPIKSHSPTIDSEAASQSTGTDQGRNKPPIPKRPMRAFEKDKGNAQQPSTDKRPSKDSAADVEKIADSKRHDHGTAIAENEEGKAGIAYPIKDDQKSTKDREMYDGEESGGNTIRELLQAVYPQRSGKTEGAPCFEHKTSLTPDVEGIDVNGMEAPIRMAKDSKTLGEVIKGYEDDLDTLKSRLGPRLYDSILASGKLKDTAGYFPADAMTSQKNVQDDESAGNVSKYDEEQPETGHEIKSNPNETKATETNKSPQQLMDNAAENKIKPKVPRRSMAGSKEQPTETSGAENSQKRPQNVRPNMNSNEYPSETSGTETGFSAKKMENVSADEHQDEQISDQASTDDLSILSQNEILDDNKTIEDVLSDLAEELKTLKSQLGSDLYNCLLATGKQSEEADKDLPSKKQQGSNYDISDILEQLSDERTIDENSKEIPDIDLSNDQDAELKVAINNQTPSRVKVPESKRQGQGPGLAKDKAANAKLMYPTKKDQIQKLTRDRDIFDGDMIDDDNIHEPTQRGHPRDERMGKPTYPHQKTYSTPDMEEFDTYGMEAPVRMSKDNKTLGEVIKGYEDDLDTLKSRLGPRLFDSILSAGKLVDTDRDYPAEEITPQENVRDASKAENAEKVSKYEEEQHKIAHESESDPSESKAIETDKSPKQLMDDGAEKKMKPNVPRRPMVGSKEQPTETSGAENSQKRPHDVRSKMDSNEYPSEISGTDTGVSPKKMENVSADEHQDEQISVQASTDNLSILSQNEILDDNKTIEDVLSDLVEELKTLKSQLGSDLYNCLLATGKQSEETDKDLPSKKQRGSNYDNAHTPEQLSDEKPINENEKEIPNIDLSNDQYAERAVATDNQKPSRVKAPESKRHGQDTGFADDKVGNAELTYPIKKDQIQKLTRDGEIFDGDVIDDDNIHEPTKRGHPRDERMDKPTYPHQKTSSTPDMEEFDTYGMEAPVRMAKDSKTLGEVIKGYEDDLDTLKSRIGPRLFESILAAGKLVDTDRDYPVEEITTRENVQSGKKPEDSGKNSQYEGKQFNEVTPESNGSRGKAIGKGNDESPQQLIKDAVERKIKPTVPRRPMLGSKDDPTDPISTVDSNNRTKDSKPIEHLKETSGKDAGDSHKRPKDSASETANNITADKYQDEESSDQAGETSTPLTKKERRDGQVYLSPDEMVDENKTIENVLNDLAEELQILKSQLGQDLYNCLLANGRGDKTGEDDLRTKERGSSYDISTTSEQLADTSTYDEDAKEIPDNNVSNKKNAERAMATDNQKPKRGHVPVSKQHDHGPDIADEIGDKEERFSKDDRMQKSISNEEIYDGDVDADNNIQDQEKRTDKLPYTEQKTSLTPDAEGLDMYEMEAPTRMSKDNKTLGEVIKGYEDDLDTLKSRLGPRLFDSLLAAGKLKDTDGYFPADAIATKEKIQDVNKAGSAGKDGLYSQEQTDKVLPDSDGTIKTAADSVEEKQQLMDDEVEKQMKPNVPRRTNLGSKEQSMENSRSVGSDRGSTVSRPITGSEEYPRETSGTKGPKDTIEKTENISRDKYEDGSSDQAREAFTPVTKLGSESDLIDVPQEKMIDENKTVEDVLSDYVEELQTLKSQIGPDLYNCLLANGKRDTRDDKDDMSKTGTRSTSGISGKPTDDKRYEDSNERQDLYLTNEKGVEYPSSKDSKQPDRSRDTEAKGKGVKSRDIVPESTAQVKTTPQDDQFGQVRTNNDQEPGEILLDKLTKYGDLQAKTGDDDGNASIESGEIIDLELSMENTPTFDGNMLAPIQMKGQNQTLQDVLKGYENDLETLRDKLGPDLYNAILDAHKEKKVLGQPQKDKGAYLADVYDDEMGSRESASTKDHTQEKAHTPSAVRRPDDIEVDNILDMNDLKAEVSSKLEPTVKQSKTDSDSTLMKENDGEFMQPSASTGGDMKTERRDAKPLAKPRTTTTSTGRTNGTTDNDSGDTEDKENKDDDDKYQQPSSSAGMAMKRERMEAKPFLKASNLLREPDNTLQDIIEGYENALDALTSALGPNLTKSILDSEAKKDTKGDRKKDTKKDKIDQYLHDSLQEDSYVPDSAEQPLEKNGAAAQDTHDREYKTKEHETGETSSYKDPSSVHDLDKEIPTKEKIKGKITDKDREQGISDENYTESSNSGTRKNGPLTETELLSDAMTEKIENGITLEDLLRVLEQENEKLKSKLGPNLTMLILEDEDTNKATHKPMAAQGEVSTDQQQSPFDHMDEVSETKMQQDVEKPAGIDDGIKEVQKPDDSLSLDNQSSKQQSDDKTLNTQGTVPGKTLSVDDDLMQEQARKESDLLKNALLLQLNDDNHKTLEDVMQDLCDDLQTLKQRLGPNLTSNLLRMGRDHKQPSTESAKDRANVDNENMDKSDEESSDEFARKNPTTGRSGSDNIPLDAERESETNILNVHSDKHQAARDQALEVETSPRSAQARNTSLRYSEEERPEVDLDALAHMSDKDETLEEIIQKYEDTLDRYERALGPHLSKAILSKIPAPETLHDDHRAETQNQDQSYIAEDTENQDQSSGNQNDKQTIPTQKPDSKQLSKQEQEAAGIDEAEKEEIMKPKHKDGKRSPSMPRKKSGRCVLLGEEMTQQQSETELLEEPMKLIQEGTTLEDLIADYVEDLQTLKSIQGDDGKPLSIDDITAAYKKQIKDLEHKNNEMNRDLDTLETKLGPTLFKKLSNPTQPPQIKTGEESKTVDSLEQERDSQQQTRERSEDQPNFKSKILENPLEEGAFTETTAETLRDSHKIALDKYGKSTEPIKTRAPFKQGHTTDRVGNMELSPIEAPFIMDQHNQTLEEVIAEYEAQLKEMLSNQEALKTELDTLEQSIGPKLFKELCELKEEEKEQNIEKVAEEVKEKEQQSKDLVKKGGDKSKKDSEEDPKKETKFEFEAINKMNEQEKPLASVLDDYQDKCNLLEKENESLQKALSNVSGDFDVGKMISDYENKIQMLKNENKEAEKQYEEKYKELQNEIKDLRDTLEKLAQTLRQDFLEDLMKQQDTANRIEAFQKMENENKTLAEVVEEYEENMKRLEREKAVLKQLAGEGEEGASMLDTISDYEDSINSLKDVNKMLNQRIDALSKKIGPVLTEQLTELCEKTDKGSEKLEGEKTKLPAIQNMEGNNLTLEDILKLYENQSKKDGDDAGLEKLEKSLGKDLMTDLNDLDNKSLDELQDEEKRPIALWIMKKRKDNLADVIKLYENYLLQYGVLETLKGESLASELQDAFEDIPVEVKNEAIVCEAPPSELLTSEYGTMGEDDLRMTSEVESTDKDEEKENQLSELQKQLEEEKELKEKYQKDVEDLLNDIVRLKLKNASDDEDKEELERQIKEEYETKQENERTKDELIKAKGKNKELEKEREALKDEIKNMEKEIKRLEKALKGMKNDTRGNDNDLAKKIEELKTKNEELEKEVEDLKSQLKEKEENYQTEKDNLIDHKDQEKKDTIKDLLKANAEVELQLQEQLSAYHDLEEKFKEMDGSSDKEDNEKLRELKMRNESLKEQLDHAEEAMKQALEKYQEQIKALETENAKAEEDKRHEIELLNNKLELEKKANEKLKEEQEEILKKSKNKMEDDFESDLERERRKMKKDLEEQMDDLERLRKKHEQELNDLNDKSKKEKNNLNNLFEEEKEKLLKDFDEKIKEKDEEHEKELEKLREEIEDKMIAQRAELNVQFNQEKTVLQAQIEKNIYGDEIQKSLDLESDFQGTLNKVLEEHASEIEGIDREMKQAGKDFQEEKNKLLAVFEKEREKDKREYEKLRQEMESNIENMLKEIIKLKHQRKEMRQQHRIEKQNMEDLFENERNEIQASIERSKNELLTKLTEEHENEIKNFREKYEEIIKDLQETLDKSEARKKELEEKLRSEELKVEQSNLNNAADEKSHEVQKEIKVIKRSIEVEYEQKLSVEKQRFEETLQGLRREVGTLQEKRKIIQERVYNQEGGHTVEKHVIEKSIANYKMEVLSKLEGEMAQRLNRERKPLEEEIKELQTENEELKRQRWEMKVQFRREKAGIEEKYEKEKETMEQSFNKEREDMRKRLEATLQKQEKMNRMNVSSGEALSSPRVDNTVRMLQQENLSLVTQNARLEADVQKMTEKLESIEGNFKEMVEYEKSKATRVKQIQQEMPKKTLFQEMQERQAPEYQLPTASASDDVVFQSLQEKDHQIHQLLETKRYYETVLGELCDEAGLFELDRNEVV